MIKRFLIILVMLFWCSAGVAMDVKEYLHTRQNGSNADQKLLDFYILELAQVSFGAMLFLQLQKKIQCSALQKILALLHMIIEVLLMQKLYILNQKIYPMRILVLNCLWLII